MLPLFFFGINLATLTTQSVNAHPDWSDKSFQQVQLRSIVDLKLPAPPAWMTVVSFRAPSARSTPTRGPKTRGDASSALIVTQFSSRGDISTSNTRHLSTLQSYEVPRTLSGARSLQFHPFLLARSVLELGWVFPSRPYQADPWQIASPLQIPSSLQTLLDYQHQPTSLLISHNTPYAYTIS